MDIKTREETYSEKKKIIKTGNKKRQKGLMGTYLLLGLACLVAYFLFRFQVFHLPVGYEDIFRRYSLAAFCCFFVLFISKIAETIVIKQSHNKAILYNVIRLIKLLSVFLIALIVISFVFENWYTAAVSLGLFSLIIGFALQSPISSLIGWLYIVIRAPYKVGDRIQVNNFTGDVVEIGYFDTTLWEFGGNYMTNDLPSGRLIRFLNSLIWQNQIYNYSWKKFPYIWNEIPFHIAYDSDLAFVEQTIREVAKKQLGERMEDRVQEMRNLIRQTAVNELEIKDYPFVNLRINDNTWVEVLLVYLVEPRKASAVRTELIKKILEELLKQPEKVKFPIGNVR